LTWTATGDDSLSGTASQYDIRYSQSSITDANWDSATPVTGVPNPKAAGSRETFVVSGLSASTPYYFALKVGDEKAHWSALSDVASDSTTTHNVWLQLGSGTDGPVYALTVYNGQLMAAGVFVTAGGVAAGHIAAWDGSSWLPLSSGTDYWIGAITEYNGKLTAGGSFTSAGAVTASNVAAWSD
jgi:hypothetical protein